MFLTEVPADICCDICNPTLFDQVRPAKPVAERRARTVKRGHPVSFVRNALYAWRRSIKHELYQFEMWGPQAILDSANCELLASVGPIETMETLSSLLKNNWARWDSLGGRLFDMLSALDIPKIAAAPKLTSSKRTATTAELSSSAEPKRRRPGPIENTPFPDSAYDTFFSSAASRYKSVRVAEAHELLQRPVGSVDNSRPGGSEGMGKG